MEKLRIGVLGCANIAERMVIPAIIASEFAELSAVASRRLDKAQKMCERFGGEAVKGYDALVERDDVDALYIPLPNGLHREWVLKGIAKGKHILCEKSLGVTIADTNEMVAAAKQKGVLLMENFMFTFHSQQQKIKEIIDSGELGDIKCLRSSFGFPPFRDLDNIRYNRKLGGGALLDAGAYPIKATQFFLGRDCTLQGSHLTIDAEKGVDLHGGALLVADQSIVVQLAWGFDNYYQCNMEIWGNKGKLTAHRIFTAGPGVKPMITLEKQDEKHEIALRSDNHFVNILNDFCNTIKSGDFEEKYLELLSQSQLIEDVRRNAINTK